MGLLVYKFRCRRFGNWKLNIGHWIFQSYFVEIVSTIRIPLEAGGLLILAANG